MIKYDAAFSSQQGGKGEEFMKFAVSSKGNSVSDTLKNKIQTYLLDFGMELNEEEPDLVITVGGDGTLYTLFTGIATV